MKLMTNKLAKRFAEVGWQTSVLDPIVIAKFFYPAGSGKFYAIEYYPKANAVFRLYVYLWG